MSHRSLFTRHFIITISLSLVWLSTVHAEIPKDVSTAVADETRPADHKARDEGRKPAEVLALAGIKSGDKVGEIAPGGGYYTALLSRLVGETGKVYAVDPQLIFEAFPQAKEGFQKYIAEDPRANVEYFVQRLDEFAVPEKLDSIFMVLYYHDTLWTGEDRNKMNIAFFNALKPGGKLFIVDHNAMEGSGVEPTQKWHRMDGNLVLSEVPKAGFELSATSDLLRNDDDPLNISVFDEQWRGKTDRFIYIFNKPDSEKVSMLHGKRNRAY